MFLSNKIIRNYCFVHLILLFVFTFLLLINYSYWFSLFWHRMAYPVLMVPLRIYSLTAAGCGRVSFVL